MTPRIKTIFQTRLQRHQRPCLRYTWILRLAISPRHWINNFREISNVVARGLAKGEAGGGIGECAIACLDVSIIILFVLIRLYAFAFNIICIYERTYIILYMYACINSNLFCDVIIGITIIGCNKRPFDLD